MGINDDPQENIRFGMIPESFNQSLAEIVQLAKANPQHAALQEMVRLMPGMAKEAGVVLPS